jgi:hypothetical protein
MKKLFLTILALSFLYSCDSPEKAPVSEDIRVPELVLVDSLVVDRLTQFDVVDINEDSTRYLLYDWSTNEFMISSPSGEILAIADLTGDGKNSYQERYFIGAKFYGKDQILIQAKSGVFSYDLNFNLIAKRPTTYSLETRHVDGSRSFNVFGSYIYTFSIEEKDQESVYPNEEFSKAYPFFTIRDAGSLAVVSSIFVPEGSSLFKNPGFYNNLDPIVQVEVNSIFVLYPNSPELYIYDLPSLGLRKSIDLVPNEAFKVAKPYRLKENLRGFFNSLAASEYQYFAFSNGYLLTMYDAAAPQEEVDALPKDQVGGEEFMALLKKHKFTYTYQIFKEEKKIWEGDWDISLKVVRDVIFSFSKIGEDPDAQEKDFQTVYFYELK